MKKNTLVLAAVFVALLCVAVFAGGGDSAPTVQRLHIDGWKGGDKEKKVDDAPFDSIELKNGDLATRFVRDPEDKAKWRITAPRDSEAEGYRIRAILNLFSDDLDAVVSQKLKEGAEGLFGLKGDDLISLKMTGKTTEGAVKAVELLVGRVDREKDASTGTPSAKTWVSAPGSGTVHLVEGKDLRKALDLSLNELRSKRLLRLGKWADVDRLEIANPKGDHPRIVVERDLSAPPPEPKEGEENNEGDEPKKPEAWKLAEPAGYQLGEARSVFSGLVNLNASEFVAAADAPKDTGLDGDSVVTVSVKAGTREATLKVGPEVDGDAWVKIEGRDDEVYKVSSYSRKQLVKGLADLRDKKILGVADKADVNRVELVKSGARPLVLEKRGDIWKRSDGRTADKDAMGTLTGAIANFRVSEFDGKTSASDAGLDKAALKVRFVDKGIAKEVHIGREDDGKVFARAGLDGEVVKVSSYTLKQLDKGWDDLRNKRLFDVDKATIVTTRITSASGETIELMKNPGDSDDWSLVKPPTGKALKQFAARSIATTFSNLKAKGFHRGKKAASVGLGSKAGTLVDAVTKDGVSFKVRVSEQKDGEDPYVVTEGGLMDKTVVTIAGYQAKNLTKTLDDLYE